MPRRSPSPPSGTQSIRRAIGVLRVFSPEKPEWRLQEIADELALIPSTVHRILAALRSEGLVERNPLTTHYRLGRRTVEFADQARQNGFRRLMPQVTPLHRRASAANESWVWRDWSGYLAASSYLPTHEREYWAIRNSVAMIDVSPLYKYDVTGPDAERLLDRVMTRDISKCRVGQVMYSCWCDEEGKLIQDGNLQRLEDDVFRVTSADPSLRWFEDNAEGMDVAIEEVTEKLGAIALQGPRARDVLRRVTTDLDLDGLRYFRLARGTFADGLPLVVTRTGFTGDLGYELWALSAHAERLWDELSRAGAGHGILPAGMLALDMARIEAGLVLIEVDFISAPHALLEARKSTPLELGLGFTVKLDKEREFIGQEALREEAAAGSQWELRGLEVPWQELERVYRTYGLRPQWVGEPASRVPVRVFWGDRQIGQCTSQMFSPLLKKHIGLASIRAGHVELGDEIELEMTIEFSRERVRARVVRAPFFNPKRKTAYRKAPKTGAAS